MNLYSFCPLFLYYEIINMVTYKRALFGQFFILLFYSDNENEEENHGNIYS